MPKLPRLLIIDDDGKFVTLLKRALIGYFDCITAERFSAAEGIIERNHLDLICTDMGLEDTDGMETIERLLPIAGDTPVVVLTGNSNPHTAKRALSMGCVGYIPKPLDITILPDRLERAIVRGQYLAQVRQEREEAMTAVKRLQLENDSLNRQNAILSTNIASKDVELVELRKQKPPKQMSTRIVIAWIGAGAVVATGLIELVKAMLSGH